MGVGIVSYKIFLLSLKIKCVFKGDVFILGNIDEWWYWFKKGEKNRLVFEVEFC